MHEMNVLKGEAQTGVVPRAGMFKGRANGMEERTAAANGDHAEI